MNYEEHLEKVRQHVKDLDAKAPVLRRDLKWLLSILEDRDNEIEDLEDLLQEWVDESS
jgi:hypothetical protein